jgi:hypothetical protein
MAIEALLSIIEEIADERALRRMIVAVNLEQPALMDRKLSFEWNLRSFARTVLIELDPLAAVNQYDARLWYIQRRINDLFGVSEESVAALFPSDTSLRMRVFESRVQPLLTTSRQLPR